MSHPTSAQAQYGIGTAVTHTISANQQSTLPFTGVGLVFVAVMACVCLAVGIGLLWRGRRV